MVDEDQCFMEWPFFLLFYFLPLFSCDFFFLCSLLLTYLGLADFAGAGLTAGSVAGFGAVVYPEVVAGAVVIGAAGVGASTTGAS